MENGRYLYHAPTIRLFKLDITSEKIFKDIEENNLSFDKRDSFEFLLKKYASTDIDIFYNFIDKLQSISSTVMKDSILQKINGKPDIKSLILYVTDGCNMNCSYCFEGSNRQRPDFLSINTAKVAIDQFLKKKNDENLSLSFFGGEPLLNLNVIRNILNYISADTKSSNITINLTTNGLLLSPDTFNFLSNYNVKILLSMDGPELIHDRWRKGIDGSNTYHRILKNLEYALERRADLISIRATITPNVSSLVEIVNHFMAIGVNDIGFDIAIGDYANCPVWNEDNISQYESMYKEYVEDILQKIVKGKPVPLHILSRINKILKREKTLFPCRMGRELLVVGPNGNYYPCHWFIGNKDFTTGNVTSGFSESKQMNYYPPPVQDKLNCRNCWARSICDGTCSAIQYSRCGNAQAPDPIACYANRIVWKWTIWLYAKLIEIKMDLRILVQSGYNVGC